MDKPATPLIERLQQADGPRLVWPTVLQSQAQAVFDAEDGRYSPECPSPSGADYCGECGRIASLNPDNDLCQPCAAALSAQEASNDRRD